MEPLPHQTLIKMTIKASFLKKTSGHGYSTYANFTNVNKDIYPDLLIERDNLIEVYLNDKHGDFIFHTKFKEIDAPFDYGLISFDMDNDGDDDILLQKKHGSKYESKTIFLKNNSGKYEVTNHKFQNTYQGNLTVIDINKDLFTTSLIEKGKTNTSKSLFYISEQKNQFTKIKTNILEYNLPKTCFVDIENDGDMDLIIMGSRGKINSPQYKYESVIDIYLNDNGSFKLFKEKAFNYLSQGSVNAADIDADGDQDILITGYNQDDSPKTLLYVNKMFNLSTKNK